MNSTQADGSSADGVKALTKKSQYWIFYFPSQTLLTVNTDSAIVGSDDKICRFQFMVVTGA